MIWLSATQRETAFLILDGIVKEADKRDENRQADNAEKLVRYLRLDHRAGGTESNALLRGLTNEGAYAAVREYSRQSRTIAARVYADGTVEHVSEQARRSVREIGEDGKAGRFKQLELWLDLDEKTYRRIAARDIRAHRTLGGVVARHLYVLDALRRFPEALTPRQAIILDGKDPDNLEFADVSA